MFKSDKTSLLCIHILYLCKLENICVKILLLLLFIHRVKAKKKIQLFKSAGSEMYFSKKI